MADNTRIGRKNGTPWVRCPHVNRNDLRCGSRFTLGRLDQAYAVCFGSYRGCPMYHRINRELHDECATAVVAASAMQSSPLVQITANGNRLSLRPTGT